MREEVREVVFVAVEEVFAAEAVRERRGVMQVARVASAFRSVRKDWQVVEMEEGIRLEPVDGVEEAEA